ncbi:MAG TPA: nitroreductase family deazaflavin-dependent oxidoreductase [Ilumatobacter sp.]|nr:nitroreductase family deazaflavin-dependent oxidoreductase [Ilumatobacter sp.]
MGSAEAIGYDVKPCNVAQRVMQRVASSKPGAWAFSKGLHRADRRLFAWSKGRVTVPSILAGLPVLMVTTTGAKSGKARTMPLLAVPVGPDLAIIGTNFGQTDTPGWVFNLEADPHATVSYRDREVAVTARLATDDEFDLAFTAAAKVYPGYAKYRQRITGRPIRVFVLHTSS